MARAPRMLWPSMLLKCAPGHCTRYTPDEHPSARTRLTRTLTLPLPAIASALADGNAPVAVGAPTSRSDAFTIMRSSAPRNSIPVAFGPNVRSTLRIVTRLNPSTLMAAPVVTSTATFSIT